MVEGEEDEESYESEFANSILNDNVDDSGTRIELGSHKENPEVIDDDNVNKIKKKNDDRKDETVEKMDDAEEKDNDDHTDHSLIEPQETGSKEIRNEKMQTPIFTPIRSPRKDLSLDKTILEELTTTVSPTTATTSKDLSTPKHKKIYISYKTKIPPGSIAGMCRRRAQIRSHIKNKFITHEFFMKKIREVLDHCNNVVPEMTFAKTNEMIKKEMPRLVNLAVNKDCEINPINIPEKISKEFCHTPKRGLVKNTCLGA
ncbi:hypothetical protein Tco_0997968 [Tanacetum coccineum]